MSTKLSFTCPQCGGKQFKTAVKVESLDDFNGAVCAGCGRVASDADVKKFAKKYVADMLSKTLKGAFKGSKNIKIK